MAIQEAHDTAWNEEKRLAAKNFTCEFCSQRFNEEIDLQYQDDLQSLPVCPYCFEPNGGELVRSQGQAEAAELAARLTEKEMVPPKEPGWFEPSTVVCISGFSSKPLVVNRSGSEELTLTGIFTYLSGGGLSNGSAAVITDEDSDGIYDQVVLTVAAAADATISLQPLTHVSGDYSDLYTDVFDVRA